MTIRRDRAALLTASNRRRGLLDPLLGLFGTHSFPIGTSNILTGTVFPDRTKPVTVSCEIEITGAAPQGVVFELGSATTGLAIWVASADSRLMAAAGDAAAADGVTLTGPVVANGQRLRVSLAVTPPDGKARLWVDGHLVASGQATGGSFPNGWSDDGEGAVGAVDTTVTARVAVADRIALTNAAVVASVKACNNQRPRQFHEVA